MVSIVSGQELHPLMPTLWESHFSAQWFSLGGPSHHGAWLAGPQDRESVIQDVSHHPASLRQEKEGKEEEGKGNHP